jgi:hypothetical protein
MNIVQARISFAKRSFLFALVNVYRRGAQNTIILAAIFVFQFCGFEAKALFWGKCFRFCRR